MLLLLLLLCVLCVCGVRSFCVCLSLLRFLCFSSVFFCVGCVKEEVKKRKFDECFALKKKGGKKKEGKTQKNSFVRSFVRSFSL